MRIEPVSGQVLEGPLEPVYVYEAPVRLWHWVTMVAMFVLAATGYLIGSPPPAIGGEAAHSYLLRWIRMIALHRRHGVRGDVPHPRLLGIRRQPLARAMFVSPVWSGDVVEGTVLGKRRITSSCAGESELSGRPQPACPGGDVRHVHLGTIFIIADRFRAVRAAVGVGHGVDEHDGLGDRRCWASRRRCARCTTSPCGTSCCSPSSTCTWCSARTS